MSHHLSFPSQPEDEPGFYSAYDPSSSFQVNPSSSHPPRTPRTSIIATADLYGSQIYEDKVEEDTDEEEQVPPSTQIVRNEDVWRELFLTSNGRDKAFKIIQYSLKVYLVFHTTITANRFLKKLDRPPWERELIKRLQSMISGLSFSRKTLLLFNWLGPLTAITSHQTLSLSTSTKPPSKSAQPFLHMVLHAPPPVLLDLLNCMSDDMYTLSLLGLLSKRTGERAARFSDWCWFLATIVGLVENGVERQMLVGRQHEVESRMYKTSLSSGATINSKSKLSKADEGELLRLQDKDFWSQISRAKLLLDLVFVSYDIFRIKKAKGKVQTFAGFASALLSCAKLLDRHRTTLAQSGCS